MQRAEESESRAGGLTPLKAFLVGLGLLVAIAAVVLLSRPDEAPVPSPNPNPEPAFALTDAEAIATFRALDAARLQAYSQRDLSLVTKIFSSDSPIRGKVAREITTLKRDQVVSRTQFESLSLDVVENGDSQIVLRHTVRVTPRFEDESGQNVTGTRVVQLQTIRWTLVEEDGEWRLYDAVITKSKEVQD